MTCSIRPMRYFCLKKSQAIVTHRSCCQSGRRQMLATFCRRRQQDAPSGSEKSGQKQGQLKTPRLPSSPTETPSADRGGLDGGSGVIRIAAAGCRVGVAMAEVSSRCRAAKYMRDVVMHSFTKKGFPALFIYKAITTPQIQDQMKKCKRETKIQEAIEQLIRSDNTTQA